MKEKLFFLTSKKAAARLTGVFDFVWPTATAIWNLRWQVKGLVSVEPKITEEALLGRFVTGSGIRGANLRRSCINTTWEEQQNEFSRFLLFEFCSLYEAWCEGCIDELCCPISNIKNLQFPTTTDANGNAIKGVQKAINSINKNISTGLKAALYPKLLSNKKNSLTHLENLLVCYRYFKELRNLLIHAGGSSSTLFIQAENNYKTLTAASLGVSEVPEIISFKSDETVKVSLRGVVGFGEIVLRLIATLDAELSQSRYAEMCFINRWKSTHQKNAILLAVDVNTRKNSINKLIRKLDLPKPILSPSIEIWLKSIKLIR